MKIIKSIITDVLLRVFLFTFVISYSTSIYATKSILVDIAVVGILSLSYGIFLFINARKKAYKYWSYIAFSTVLFVLICLLLLFVFIQFKYSFDIFKQRELCDADGIIIMMYGLAFLVITFVERLGASICHFVKLRNEDKNNRVVKQS